MTAQSYPFRCGAEERCASKAKAGILGLSLLVLAGCSTPGSNLVWPGVVDIPLASGHKRIDYDVADQQTEAAFRLGNPDAVMATYLVVMKQRGWFEIAAWPGARRMQLGKGDVAKCVRVLAGIVISTGGKISRPSRVMFIRDHCPDQRVLFPGYIDLPLAASHSIDHDCFKGSACVDVPGVDVRGKENLDPFVAPYVDAMTVRGWTLLAPAPHAVLMQKSSPRLTHCMRIDGELHDDAYAPGNVLERRVIFTKYSIVQGSCLK